MENLSPDGKLAMKENQITLEDVYTFTEGDINDLFKSFGDRRIVRKLIELKQKTDYIDKKSTDLESEINETCTTDSETEKSSTSTSTCASSIPTKFNVDEMLQKKKIRGKSNSALSFFNNLMKDGLKATKLWKNPILLQDISTRKKEEFHTIIENHVPALKSKRSEIWRRVGEHLQNRRKYLKDLNSGKRRSFLAQKHETRTSEKRKQNDSGLCDLKPGDLVKLKHYCDSTGEQVTVGTGIFLSQEDDVYSNVVLKSKDMEITMDVDLPAVTSDGATTLKNAGMKQMILFWTQKLEKAEVKKKKVMPNTSRNLVEMSKEKSSSTDTDCETSVPSKRLIDVDLLSSKCLKRNINFRSFVLMEWANHKMFWGIKCVTETDFLIRNTIKSCGKLDSDSKVVADNTANVRLSSTDVEVNPNMRYCIWEIPKDNELLKLDSKVGKFGCLQIVDREKFGNLLQQKLQSYNCDDQ